ncbi:hypothetical protein PRK78_003796 [Emydomyces testavorans]|uniref:Uncharacterized protein n=1 Tax=Emydomyces testavorans TaxID=2070801 RepID=A0AAF0DHI2_9EURO|nr:hypothetical protein PRK78_003796 [Emydomyces testavorans]
MSTQIRFQTRSIYRSILRELPQRPLSAPSPLQTRIRTSLAATNPSTTTTTTTSNNNNNVAQARLEEAEQAQRQYTTLLERYNPGANMNEQERVRLTARRVGMNLPVEA